MTTVVETAMVWFYNVATVYSVTVKLGQVVKSIGTVS